MAPRRHRSSSNAQGPAIHQNVPPPTQRTQTPGTASQRQLGMSPAVYQSNMKVLLRREPSITAIIDQFSHVCLYHHNGQKWEKHGYEGSMFLFEKSTYPTYGFYILNRMGTDDYVRPIYPEDDMEIMGDYLMCRFYPDFTKTRLDMGLPYPIPPEHRAAFDRELFTRISPEEQEKEREKKGRSIILGLWMFATDAREPLKEVMMRLHSYVKRGLPYPDEYKYGPGRPPPPNPHLRTTSRSSLHTPSQDPVDAPHASALPSNGVLYNQHQPSLEQASAATSGAGSELDKLFAKLMPPSASAPPPTAPPAASSMNISLNDLFAAAAKDGNQTGIRSVPPPQPQPLPQPELTPSRGLALLDSIFASATPASSAVDPNQPTSSTPLPPHPDEITIVSPKPTSSALPQILSQDVISTLLGLAPDSRASSAAPSSVGSRRSNPNRYEGDNEYSEGEPISDGGPPSRTGTVDTAARARTTAVPTFSVQPVGSSESEPEGDGRPGSSRRVPGDVTPRPPAGGLRLPAASPPRFQQQARNGPTTSVSAPALNGNGAAASVGGARASTPRERPLVPFEANSELWPYPRAPLDDRSLEHDADVVELDFADTRALSDPALFSTRLKEKEKRRGGKGRRSRREREADRERERAEIERGWDMPADAGMQEPAQEPYPLPDAREAASPRPSTTTGVNCASESKSAAPAKKAPVNGANSAAPPTNGRASNGSLNGVSAKEAILSALSGKKIASEPALAKNDFVRELLTLIHMDPQFVDGLWQEYLARAT
ncbi:hypothetical protein BD413DRAFT_200113 [Trametes elegans]|nr:hypothetical protein BD413DRAFT_200113 [Trametes elegans]